MKQILTLLGITIFLWIIIGNFGLSLFIGLLLLAFTIMVNPKTAAPIYKFFGNEKKAVELYERAGDFN